jgi:hypothetical protein
MKDPSIRAATRLPLEGQGVAGLRASNRSRRRTRGVSPEPPWCSERTADGSSIIRGVVEKPRSFKGFLSIDSTRP